MRGSIFRRPPKKLYFLCNSFSLRFTEKSSQTNTFSRKVFFMFCLEHFSLKWIIKTLFIESTIPIRQVCEKYLANGKDVFLAFMDLEKSYDTIDLNGMWQILIVHGVGEKLLKAVQNLYKNRVCAQGGKWCEWVVSG